MQSPFDDVGALIADLPGPDVEAREAATAGLEPDMGRLHELAAWLAAWQGRAVPRVRRPIVALYAAAHAGAEGEAGAARRRLDALAAGEGAIGRAARELGAGVEVFDLAVDRPVPDAAERPTMSEREAAATLAFGMEALAKTPDLLILGQAASGAERAAGALALALFGGPAEAWSAAPDWSERAIARARADGATDPLDLMRHLGGRETAALAGAILAARSQRVPVVLDGYAAAAAAAVLHHIRADALDHCVASDGQSPAHARLLERLGKAPILRLGVDGGEGLAGVAAIGVLRTASALKEEP